MRPIALDYVRQYAVRNHRVEAFPPVAIGNRRIEDIPHLGTIAAISLLIELSLCDGNHAGREVETMHIEAVLEEPEHRLAGPAPDIEHTPRLVLLCQLPNQFETIKITAVVIVGLDKGILIVILAVIVIPFDRGIRIVLLKNHS